MEITEHERVLLVNSLIQTISELYEHRRGQGPLRTRSAAYPHDGGLPGTRATRAGSHISSPPGDCAEVTACARTPHFQRRARANPPRSPPGRSAAGQGTRSSPAHPVTSCKARPPTAMRRMPPSQSSLARLAMSTALRPRPASVSRQSGRSRQPPHPGVASNPPGSGTDRTVQKFSQIGSSRMLCQQALNHPPAVIWLQGRAAGQRKRLARSR